MKEIFRTVTRSIAIKLLHGYKGTWNFHARTQRSALSAICEGVHDEATFDAKGKEFAERLKQLCPPGVKALDVGCGIGRVEKWFAGHCSELHAVDVSSRMLRYAKSRCRGIENVYFHLGNGRDLAMFEDATFGFVFCVYVLQHMEREDVVRNLAEIRRVLSPGGVAYLQFPNLLHPHNLQAFYEYSQKNTARGWARMRYYTPQEVNALLQVVGLQLTREEHEGSDIYVQARVGSTSQS